MILDSNFCQRFELLIYYFLALFCVSGLNEIPSAFRIAKVVLFIVQLHKVHILFTGTETVRYVFGFVLVDLVSTILLASVSAIVHILDFVHLVLPVVEVYLVTYD